MEATLLAAFEAKQGTRNSQWIARERSLDKLGLDDFLQGLPFLFSNKKMCRLCIYQGKDPQLCLRANGKFMREILRVSW